MFHSMVLKLTSMTDIFVFQDFEGFWRKHDVIHLQLTANVFVLLQNNRMISIELVETN